jgi:hypothetical protein
MVEINSSADGSSGLMPSAGLRDGVHHLPCPPDARAGRHLLPRGGRVEFQELSQPSAEVRVLHEFGQFDPFDSGVGDVGSVFPEDVLERISAIEQPHIPGRV